MNAAERVFSHSESLIFDNLLKDEQSRRAIFKQVARDITDTAEVLARLPYEQLLCMLLGADFASEDEHLFVAGSMRRYLRERNPLPMVTEHQGLELASRCLVSLGLFRKEMRAQAVRYGAPSARFYRNIGVSAFETESRRDLAYNFDNWAAYLQDNFTLN